MLPIWPHSGKQEMHYFWLTTKVSLLVKNWRFCTTYTSKNPCFPYEEYDHFNLETMDSVDCKAEFRVERNDIPLLAEVLRIPAKFRCQQGTVCDGMEGLCVLLKRLAYPCRFSDMHMIPRFGKPVPAS